MVLQQTVQMNNVVANVLGFFLALILTSCPFMVADSPVHHI